LRITGIRNHGEIALRCAFLEAPWRGLRKRLTGALLDRLTHHVHILEMNGDSYRLNQSKHRSRHNNADTPKDRPTPT
jgi:IstB-like ATP binding protein